MSNAAKQFKDCDTWEKIVPEIGKRFRFSNRQSKSASVQPRTDPVKFGVSYGSGHVVKQRSGPPADDAAERHPPVQGSEPQAKIQFASAEVRLFAASCSSKCAASC